MEKFIVSIIPTKKQITLRLRFPDDCTLTIIEHLATTITYEMVDGVITTVTQQDMMDRMNDPDNTTVVAP